METAKLTIRLPKEDIAFAKAYARAHDLSVTEVVNRYLRRLRALDTGHLSPELEAITGLLPEELDLDAERQRHLRRKHGA